MTDATNTEAELEPNEASAAETAQDRDAAPWLEMIADAQRYFEAYHDHCDRIDKLYASLESMAEPNADREFAIFWANLEVLKPSVYSRPPVPVVMPKFRKRDDLPRKAAELLERALVADFEADDVDGTMQEARDDVVVNSRGAVWMRLHADEGVEQISAEALDRRDFLHQPARKWREVGWVARRAWLTRAKLKQRFPETWQDVQLEERGANPGKDDGDDKFTGEKTAEVWELWHKAENAVVWVSPGCEDVLDIRPPYMTLDGFFPCPRPAYATTERGSLMPVPDVVYYRDQMEEINELTARISHLSERLKLQGFYPGGARDVGEAIETIMNDGDNRALLVPVSNFAALGGAGLKDAIVWLPVREVAEVITALVQLRKQLIDDVYQITGLSDIMRGDSVASETLGAQQLKAQYGSIRIRQKQAELVRLARDITRMKGEIMAEQFGPETLMAMSQVDDLPSAAEIQAQMMQLRQQVARAKADPALMQQAQQNPEAAQQLLQQAQQQEQTLANTVTIEAVMNLLRSERMRPFVLEIETDSTIQPDEQAEKMRRTEFLTAVGGFIQAAGPMVQQQPETAPFVAEALKFAAGGFRAGREMDEAIDEFAEKLKELPTQQQGPDPAQQEMQMRAEAEQAKMQMEQQRFQVETQEKQGRFKLDEQRLMLDREKLELDRARAAAEDMHRTEERAEGTKREYLKANVPIGYTYDSDREAIGEAIKGVAEMLAASIQASQQSNAEQNATVLAAIQSMTAALTAPKRVVRDQTGRAIGVETAEG